MCMIIHSDIKNLASLIGKVPAYCVRGLDLIPVEPTLKVLK